MDCAGLRADIDKLKQELQAFEIDVKAIRESKGHNKELQNVARVIDSNLSDSTLERYLKDFQEQNIKIFPAFTLSERIECKALMNSLPMVIANNGHVLIGGNNGALYVGVFDEQGKITLSEQIEVGGIKNAYGNPERVYSIAATNDGHVLIGGAKGAFYSGSYDDQGRLLLDGRINIEDAGGRPADIDFIITTTDGGHVLIGGMGASYSGSYDDQGRLLLGGRINIEDADGNPATVRCMAATDDGRVLIGVHPGGFYCGFYDNSGEFILSERTDIRGADGQPVYIRSIKAASDGHVLINGMISSNDAFYSGVCDDRGRLILDEQIGVGDVNGDPNSIWSVAVIDDRRVLIGGDEGIFYEGSYDDGGKLVLGERIDIRDANGRPATINSIIATDDRRVLIGGYYGVLYSGRYDNQGKLVLSERIDIKDAGGDQVNIESILVTNDGHVLIKARGDQFYSGTLNISLETLKQHLRDIIEKSESGE